MTPRAPSERLEFLPGECLGETIDDLLVCQDVLHYDFTASYFFSDKVPLCVDMFCSSVELGVLR
jgi:hypothetical protein